MLVSRLKKLIQTPGVTGFALYTAGLFLVVALLPPAALDPSAKFFLAGIGFLAAWRYGWGLLNYVRSMIYRRRVFPRWRKIATRYEDDLMPPRIYILMTLFRIETKISSRVIRAALEEAINCGLPVTIVASVVEMQDEFLFRTIFKSYPVPDRINLQLVRLPGTGKRAGLAQGYRAISRDMPHPDSLVVVMDGDTILLPHVLRRSVPFFKMMPRLGAITTDEISEVHGSTIMKEWHAMRFVQRHILMGSVSLSRRVMTLTGRMSIFRAGIVTNPDFIAHVCQDHLDHWRLGRFKFLTGDDKSSLYWVMKQGYEQIYVPDVQVLTLEDPPSSNFFTASNQLMFRWFGNMLRTNIRILKLGPSKMPLFVWWSFADQRLSMWTTLAGPVFAVMLSLKYGLLLLAYYTVWVGFVRWVMTLILAAEGRGISWRYPFLLYYNQVYGSLLKTWVFFRLDIQSWTRQKTKLQRGLSRSQSFWNTGTSHVMHASALVFLVCSIGLVTQALTMPEATLRIITGYMFSSPG